VARALVALVVIVSLSAAAGAETFTGVISDEGCATTGHSAMRMGPTDAECTVACVEGHGVPYVLVDGKNVYKLAGKQPLQKLAGQRVRVNGTLDPKTSTITVESIAAAK
jgi:hypothetical protein